MAFATIVGCSEDGADAGDDGSAVVVTGGGADDATDVTTQRAAVDAVRPASPAELEQVILAFATCVVDNTGDIALRLRYRTDPFIGLGEEAVIDDGTDAGADLLEQRVKRCRQETGVDEAANAFLDENPVTDDEVEAVVADFQTCIGVLSTETQARVAQQQMVTLDSMAYTGELFDLPEYGLVVDCRDRAFMGEWRVFGNETLLGEG